MMNADQILGIIRHILTFGGGLLVMKGFIDEAMLSEVIGATVTFIGTIWSFISKIKAIKAVK
jgi:hypothetical protein